METPTYFNLHQFQNEYVSNYYDFIKDLDEWNFKDYLAFLEHEYFEIYTEFCNAKDEGEMYKTLEVYFDDDKFIYGIITKYGESLDDFMTERKLDFEDDKSYNDARLLFIKDNIWAVHFHLKTVIYDIYSLLYNEVAKIIITEKETKIVQPSELDFSDNSDKVKLIMLEKLGVIDYIKTIQTKPETISHTSEILSAITGIPTKTLNTYLFPMIRLHRNDEDKNSPYKNPENPQKAERELIKLKIKNINANR